MVVIGEATRAAILQDITANDYRVVAFTLKCSKQTLTERHKKRGDTNEVSFQWLDRPPHPGDYVIDTDHKTIAQVADEIKSIIDRSPR